MNDDEVSKRISASGSVGTPLPVYGMASSADSLAIGYASAAAGEKANEDCFGIMTPDLMPEVVQRGTAIAVADGGSADGSGRVAAEVTVRMLLHDFYTTPAHWSVAQAIDRVLGAANDWLYVQNGRNADLDGVVTTLSMLLIQGGTYHVAHVGDSRVYRQRGNALEQLTVDHTWPRRDMRHVLRRAVGLDSHLVIDVFSGEVSSGDVYLIASDGVWEVLGDRAIADSLVKEASPELVARQLVDQSLDNQRPYMGRNDATAIVVRVGGR